MKNGNNWGDRPPREASNGAKVPVAYCFRLLQASSEDQAISKAVAADVTDHPFFQPPILIFFPPARGASANHSPLSACPPLTHTRVRRSDFDRRVGSRSPPHPDACIVGPPSNVSPKPQRPPLYSTTVSSLWRSKEPEQSFGKSLRQSSSLLSQLPAEAPRAVAHPRLSPSLPRSNSRCPTALPRSPLTALI